MRNVGVVTVARSDYGIYQSVLRAIHAHPDLDLRVYISGMHLSPEFGRTHRQVEADGYAIADRVEMLLSSDSPQGLSISMGLGTAGFAQSFGRERPDILVVLGDRFEMFAAALAALPFRIPLAHIHGGEVTEGAIDDALRHSMTKLSHLHFVATEEYGRRVMQLGEEPWRVTVSGAPSLDQIDTVTPMSDEEFESTFGVPLAPAPVLVTFHPVTLEYEHAEQQIEEVLASLKGVDAPLLMTMPNADTHGRYIADRIRSFVASRSRAWLVDSLGMRGYFTAMSRARAMVGNSSSGLIEAPSFELPVVNIGTRQAGRVRARNVIDVECNREGIGRAVKTALSDDFRQDLRGLVNPYRRGNAGKIIADGLAEVPLDDRLSRKKFHDMAEGTRTAPTPPRGPWSKEIGYVSSHPASGH